MKFWMFAKLKSKNEAEKYLKTKARKRGEAKTKLRGI
jgi:hypothetical protein